MTQSFAFDEDTVVRALEPGRFAGTISARWNIGPVPNGGYVLAVGMAALRQAIAAPDPLTITAHYLRPSTPGPVDIEVEVLKQGRQFSTAAARLVQAGKETVRLLATYGDLSRASGPTRIAGAPPPLPPPEQIKPSSRGGNGFEFINRFDMRMPNLAFEPGHASGPAEVLGWIRFADGRVPDVHALGLIADSFPPAVFHVLAPGWVPTVELTVHVRARPTSTWLRCLFRTRFIFGGLLEEDGEIWDESGTLVALSRQLACTPRTP